MKKVLLSLAGILVVVLILHAAFSYRRYNVILITIDTLRADFLSCYNPKAAPTPNIDRIAQSGVLFQQSFTPIPITLPAHASILTSREPHELRLFNNGDVFDHKSPMVSDFLEEKGYHTAAFISLGVLKATFGLNRGFNKYEDDFDKYNGRYYKVASEVNDQVIPWLQKEKRNRFFAWIHYSDPHEPYITVDAPPDTEVIINSKPFAKFCLAKKEKNLLNFMVQPGENKVEFRAIVERAPKKVEFEKSKRYIDSRMFVTPAEGIDFAFGEEFLDIKLSTGADAHYFEEAATMKVISKNPRPMAFQLRFSGGARQRTDEIRRNYSNEVQYVDKYIGQLWDKLDELGIRNKTILILTADHGEGLKTHGNLGHVDRLYNETTRVPLMIYYPWLGHKGKSEDVLVNHMDIMPTILDLLHIRNKKKMDGVSLKRYISWSPIDWIFCKELNRERTFTSTYAPEARVNSFAMVEGGGMKLIHTPNKTNWKWEAYDLGQDPIERKNLARFNATLFESEDFSVLRGMLEEHRREAEEAHGRRKNPELDEEQERMLRDLGYVAGNDNGNGEQH